METRIKCFVPSCINDELNSPNKIFVRVTQQKLKEMLCRQANAECYPSYPIYCCEDHFDPYEDLVNYHKVKLMSDEPRLKATTILKNISVLEQPVREELWRNIPSTSQVSALSQLPESPKHVAKKMKYDDINMQSADHTSTVAFKVEEKKKDVATQYEIKMIDKSTNYKVRKLESASLHNYTEMEVLSSQETSSSATPSLFGYTTETDESTLKYSKRELSHRKCTLHSINNKPKMYLGLPKQFYWLIDYIVQQSSHKVDSLTIIITLFKIKQNDSIERISDQFEISRTKLSTMIRNGIETLSIFFQNLIVCPKPQEIKRNLPLVFKIRYSDVQIIIDCFEIEIAKPTNPLKQAQTWSQYKNCNTVKYLVGCTPNGLVSFLSEGYGGRISDKAIVEKSGLLNILPFNAVVLADRGFKEVEALFNAHGVKLLRPPSVYTGVKLTKTETIQSKVIASLRVHVERVIRRIREYAILKPHSVVNYKYVTYLDEMVTIACGLVNLQGEIIKCD